jgi:FMN phosphatase YigB (HAD superfamily)
MVGDNIESDIYGVQKNGIDTILYDPDNKYPEYDGKKISDLMKLLELKD